MGRLSQFLFLVLGLGLLVGTQVSCSGSGDTDSESSKSEQSHDVRENSADSKNSSDNTCGPDNCSGCCMNGHCYRGLENSRCGSGGAACKSCSAQKQCMEGSCIKPGCGNGLLEEGEECDGDEFRQSDCSELGYESGELKCSSNCTLDTSECKGNPCDAEQRKPTAEQRCNFCRGEMVVRCQLGGLCNNSRDSTIDCGEDGETCFKPEVGAPRCVPAGGESCDPETFDRRCSEDGSSIVRCAAHGRIVKDECPSDNSCKVVDGDPACLDSRSEECQPDQFDNHCEDNSVVKCSSRLNRTRYQDCVGDETCKLLTEGKLPNCVNESLGECEHTTPDKCHNNRRYDCRRQQWALTDVCESDEECVEFEQSSQGETIKLAACREK